MRVSENCLALIGHTKLVALDRIHSGPGRLVAKAEFLQPGGSIKDRPALRIVQNALAEGTLREGQAVVEMTSGNMGSGLAVVCAVLGHPFIAIMPAGNSPRRGQMLEAFGARVMLVPQVDGTPNQVTGKDIDAAIQEAKRIASQEGAFYVDQFNNPGSVQAHEEGTGPELWEQAGDALAGFVSCVGSAGTFVGIARFLKRQKAGMFCAAVEPEGSEVLSGKCVTKARHILQGTGYGFVPPHWDASLMDLSIAVSDDEAREYAHLLAEREGLYVGYSAAANVAASSKLLQSGHLPDNAVVGTLLCDSGLKY